jgi:hypothetical protein
MSSSSILADDQSDWSDATLDNVAVLLESLNDDDWDATKASPERPDIPSIEGPIETVPVMVTPLSVEGPCSLLMDWFPNLNGNEVVVENVAYPQPAYPRRQTCLESITSIGSSGAYVAGPFDPTTNLFEHSLDQPSSTLSQDDPNEVLESGFAAVAFTAAMSSSSFLPDEQYDWGDATLDYVDVLLESLNDDDWDATKASPERPDNPPIEDSIEPSPVLVTPLSGERPCHLFMDWFPNLNGNAVEVDIGASPLPAYPQRQTCLKSTTPTGWFPPGIYVDGPFATTKYPFDHGLDQPLPTDPDAMDAFVTSSESYEELDLKSPAKLTAKKTSVSGETPQLQTCKICSPIGLVSPSKVGGKTLSNVRQTLRKRKSSSTMNSSDHESFASGERDAHMTTMEDSKRPVSTKRRVQRSDPDIKEYITPKKEDVLFGRGGKSNNHPGNLCYRERVVVEQPNYQALPNRKKRIFSQMIVDWVHQDCKGRFVKKDKYGWFEVTLRAALKKVSQALRENHTEEGKRHKKEKSRQKSKQIGGK